MFNFLSHKQQEVQKPSKSNMERSLESNQAISSNPVTIGKGQQSPQYPGMQREEKKNSQTWTVADHGKGKGKKKSR